MISATFRAIRTARGLIAAAAVATVALTAPATATDCPDWTLDGAALAYTNDDLRRPQSHSVQAGGGRDLAVCATVPGYGWFIRRPDFTLTFADNPQRRALEFRVVSACDSVLLIHSATGEWHFDDDSNGNLDPRIRLNTAPEGIYDIWVGKIGGGTCDARLTLETFNSR